MPQPMSRHATDPDIPHVSAWQAGALQAIQAGRPAEGLELLRRVLRAAPSAEAWSLHGAARQQLGDLSGAVASYQAALKLAPDHLPALGNLGFALNECGRFAEAEAILRRAIGLSPDFAAAWFNLGSVLVRQGRMVEAVDAYAAVLRLQPDNALALNAIGFPLQETGRMAEAERTLRAALRLAPDMPGAHYNLGMNLLLQGRYEEGWREYEWRWRVTPPISAPRDFPQPLWDGQPSGARVLLHAEQGLGDTIQFCRYVPLAAARARVVLEVPAPLTRLLATLPGVETIVTQGEPLPDFDFHCPLLSLPHRFGTTLETVPAAIPYLSAEPAGVARWRDRLAPLPGRRVGLCWAGNPRAHDLGAHAIDRRRSITLTSLAPLAALLNVSFVSLQKHPPVADAPPMLPLYDWTAELHDFADTAALVAALDLVISVDTAVAHLAGALGRPVWILNRFDTCWRWLTDRLDSAWYPTARLFRQARPGDWDSVVNDLATTLAG